MWHNFANGNDDRDEAAAAEANLWLTHKIPYHIQYVIFIMQLLFYASYEVCNFWKNLLFEILPNIFFITLHNGNILHKYSKFNLNLILIRNISQGNCISNEYN